jgi:hypothetical protein
MYWEGETTGGYTNVLCFDWPASPDQFGTFYDIKLTKIIFGSRFEDEYGNPLIAYSGTAAEGSGNPVNTNRPIDINHTVFTFQLNRPNLKIFVKGPLPVSSTPVMGGEFYVPNSVSDWPFTVRGSPEELNGNTITDKTDGKYTFTLTYDVPITKVPGKYIEVRPHGNWALPPILTIEEMDYLLNHPNVINNEDYKYSLTANDHQDAEWLGPPSYPNYNCYTKTTHGVKNTGGMVRPDTTTKWVLDFNIDPYGTNTRAAHLREVFEAANWKVQRIHVGSNQVRVNDRTATVILSDDLLPGRIWSVTPDIGAFTDAAGNPSGRGYPPFSYRFWSPGTAAPVIRANRVSYSDFTKQFYMAIRMPPIPIPNIDTEVRIDCETPGASIHYNVIRSFIQLGEANGTTNIDGVAYNNVFVNKTNTTDVSWFGYNYKPTGQPPNVQGAADGFYRVLVSGDGSIGGWNNVWTSNYNGPLTGYAQNTIGNDDYATAKDTNGFFNTLVRPNAVQTPDSGITISGTNNGAPPYSALTALGDGVTGTNGINWDNAETSKVYRTVTATGSASYNTSNAINGSGHFYIGDAYGTWTKNVISDSDPRLYTGRRDYIVAAARKDAVTGGNEEYRGPELAISGVAMEGVYKTTVIFREPFELYAREGRDYESFEYGAMLLYVSGVSDIPSTTVSGFPFKGYPAGGLQEWYTDPNSRMFQGAYRIGGFVGGYDAMLNNGVYRHHITNNHLWVTWEIVTDWYMNAVAFLSLEGNPILTTNERQMVNRKKTSDSNFNIRPGGDLSQRINNDYVTATYGGITYRYGQWFFRDR